MQRYIITRVFQSIITLLILSLAVFLSVHLTGNTADYLLGPETTEADYEQLKKNFGLDRPLIVQYGDFLTDIVRLDFGTSFLKGPTGPRYFDVPIASDVAIGWSCLRPLRGCRRPAWYPVRGETGRTHR